MPKNKKLTLAVEYLPTVDLIPYVNNAKLHPEDQIAKLAASIQEFGFLDPIGIDAKNGIIEGHGRLMAAQKLGLAQVPIIRLGHLNEVQKKQYILAHNKLTLDSSFDLQALEMELDSIHALGGDIELTGFSTAELDDLFADPDAPEENGPREKKSRTITYESRLEVVVDCQSEAEQKKAFDLLQKEGFTCRILTL